MPLRVHLHLLKVVSSPANPDWIEKARSITKSRSACAATRAGHFKVHNQVFLHHPRFPFLLSSDGHGHATRYARVGCISLRIFPAFFHSRDLQDSQASEYG